MENQTQVTPIVQAVFKEELTQKGLADLRITYPSDLVVDMKDDAEFKKARKIKTERNKLVEDINRRRIDTTGELKKYGDSLIEEINEIYDVYVIPFEAEEKARKEEKERQKRELEELLTKERLEIKAFTNFVDTSRGQGSQHISDTIEAVDLIETDCFHKELIHEAIEAKKQVLADLTQMLSDAISQEKLEEEREALRIEKEKLEKEALERQRIADEEEAERKRIAEEAAEKARIEAEQKAKEEAERRALEERKAKVQERLNNLRNMPMQYFGKTSAEINKKVASLNAYELPAEEFGDHLEEAKAAKDQVVQQLGMMAQQAETTEKAQKQLEEQEAQKQQAEAEAKAKAKAAELAEQNKIKADSLLDEWRSTCEAAEASEDPAFIENALNSYRNTEATADVFGDNVESAYEIYNDCFARVQARLAAVNESLKPKEEVKPEIKTFKVKVEWSGYSRGYSVYEVEASSEEEAKENYYDGNKVVHNVTRDDRENEEAYLID